jgi:outer membrane lipoprotein carrier protein
MKQLIILITISFLFNNNSIGQSDKDAVKILDQFSANALGAPSVSMRFDLITIDQMEKSRDTLSGSVIISKDKYRLVLPDNTVWFNGETSWSLLTAEKEVTITRPDRKDNSFQNRPSAIFSMYKKGYKTRLVEEKPDSYTIDLYPEDIKNDLLRIRLAIGKSAMDLRSLEYKKRDGIIVTLYVREFNLKQIPEPDAFTFQSAKYKGIEIIDMR